MNDWMKHSTAQGNEARDREMSTSTEYHVHTINTRALGAVDFRKPHMQAGRQELALGIHRYTAMQPSKEASTEASKGHARSSSCSGARALADSSPPVSSLQSCLSSPSLQVPEYSQVLRTPYMDTLHS